jgi:hypothetical protein
MAKSWDQSLEEKKPNAERFPLTPEELKLFSEVGAILGELTLAEFERCVECMRRIKQRQSEFGDHEELRRLCRKYSGDEPVDYLGGIGVIVGE